VLALELDRLLLLEELMLEEIAQTIIRGELDADGWKLAGVRPYVMRYGRKASGTEEFGTIITRPTHLWSGGLLLPIDHVKPPKPTRPVDPTPTPEAVAQELLNALGV
jgi:hypothetical protein